MGGGRAAILGVTLVTSQPLHAAIWGRGPWGHFWS
jgi:hypothetical protein